LLVAIEDGASSSIPFELEEWTSLAKLFNTAKIASGFDSMLLYSHCWGSHQFCSFEEARLDLALEV